MSLARKWPTSCPLAIINLIQPGSYFPTLVADKTIIWHGDEAWLPVKLKAPHELVYYLDKS